MSKYNNAAVNSLVFTNRLPLVQAKDESRDKCHRGQSVTWPRFERYTSQIQVISRTD
jgi:hypothetical protein